MKKKWAFYFASKRRERTTPWHSAIPQNKGYIFFRIVYPIKRVNLSRSTYRRGRGMAPLIMNTSRLPDPQTRDANIPVARSPWRLRFVRWSLMSIVPQHGTWFLSIFRHPEFLDGSWISGEIVHPYHRLRYSVPDSMTLCRWSGITGCRLKDMASVRKSGSR